ncbi:unnamed protein product [Darwinula stevensoni]|uniref:Thioredoxin domain-containing protein n=1 Tax=Darwinula stevensoni TaxID=69355 RepID=A0A7R8XAV1_9CRUS|nr:unnamed protein product [Darwinula stevensoni]CAG0892261.1 unnamed protein product [Darwinula stevensoni]
MRVISQTIPTLLCLSLCLLIPGIPGLKRPEPEPIIEDVTAKELEQLLQHKDYVAVFWYTKRCPTCDKTLIELEKIDDDTDKFGVDFVKIGDKKYAKQKGVTTFPTLQYYRNQEPISYEGDLMDEEKVLQFLTSLDAMELPDQIEEVNAPILMKIVQEQPFVSVLFYAKACRQCEKALKELENIDDEADQLGIAFVKINDESLAEEYNLGKLPTLVYYRHGIPIIYDGDLMEEEAVLEWLVTHKSTGEEDDVIEEVTAKTLDTLIHSVTNLAVLFYDGNDKKSQEVLEELENIDDDCDAKGIQFVKIEDPRAAQDFGIDWRPRLVYFENSIPSLYDGDLMKEEEVLDWLLSQLVSDEIEDITDEMLDRLIARTKHLAVLFYSPKDKASQRALKDLETIDDECDEHGIAFVKIHDQKEAEEYGIDVIPSLVYFENGIPSLYDGDLTEEEKVLAWLIRQVEEDEIEDVTDEMLDLLIARSKFLAVLFYEKGSKKSEKILNELENIDDECDEHGIVFVKISNEDEAKEYGIERLPCLVYFENEIPSVYDGDLMKEEQVLEWLIHQVQSDEIEEVTDEMLDKLIQEQPFLAVLFYEKDDSEDQGILGELENIDDECDENGIAFVKIDDRDEAKEYGIDHLPTLIYFENGIPSIYEGDLSNEEEVLKWLLLQKAEDTIEEVTDEMLENLIKDFNYIVVYFTGEECDEGEECHRILEELENIDDETDDLGIQFVTTDDLDVAKKYGVSKFPAIVLFRNGEPLLYDGPLDDEDQVLAWATDPENLEVEDRIEKVNAKMLKRLLDSEDNIAVYFYKEGDRKSERTLGELENIDDECDAAGIDFIKISDANAARDYDIFSFPTLVYFRRKFPQIYEGDLMDEETVLEWLLNNKDATPQNDIIDLVDRGMLKMLLQDYAYVAVFFCNDQGCKNCERILEDLETIDDDTDRHGIHLVKLQDVEYAKELGITEFPSLVYFENQIPSLYEGDLSDEDSVLEWLIYQKVEDTIENINRDMLQVMVQNTEYLAVFFYKEDDADCTRALKHLETIDDDASEYGIEIVKMQDSLVAKKYGWRNPPGLTYFRKGKALKYDGDIYDEEEVLDWLTDPENMELTDHIEKVNRKMFEKIRQRSDHVAVYFYSDSKCKQCEKVLQGLENIDDEAANAGIDFVKIDDMKMAKDYGIHALPALMYFRTGAEAPIIYAGDLKNEERVLDWLIIQKDPSGDVIEEMHGTALKDLIIRADFLAVYFYTKVDCEECETVLEELENIDDDTDRHGIGFVKTQDQDIAEAYGIHEFPSLVYFEKGSPSIYEGNLAEEEDVLQWLVLQRTEDRIEAVNRDLLEYMIEDHQYLAVFFYKSNCRACDNVLTELENIDDECDLYGIQMVKINDPQLAKRYGIKTFPALVYFRNGNPLIFDASVMEASANQVLDWLVDDENRELEDRIELVNAQMLDLLVETSPLLAVLFFPKRDLKNEEGVLEWLIDDENRELADEIEAVNARMLEKLLDDSPFLAVFFYESECTECTGILEELENIDDEADMYGIDFVKINDEEAANKYNILNLPALVYFRKRTPLLYEGDLRDEEKVLAWLTSQDVFEIKDEIEEVNRKMLEKLLDENDFVAVYFYENNCQKCEEVLEKLEEIDDEADHLDITFVKIKDARYAKKYGISKLPALVYFRKRFPSIYRGDLIAEDEVLEWLTRNRFKHPELNLFMYGLAAISSAFIMYTLFLMFCFKGTHQKAA